MNYDVNFFINKFSAIPEEKFCVERLTMEETGQSCALGHCGVKPGKNGCFSCDGYTWDYQYTEEGMALVNIFQTAYDIKDWMKATEIIPCINDGLYCIGAEDKYVDIPTPKQRILAALYDIKNLTRKDATAEILALPMPVENTLDVKSVTIQC